MRKQTLPVIGFCELFEISMRIGESITAPSATTWEIILSRPSSMINLLIIYQFKYDFDFDFEEESKREEEHLHLFQCSFQLIICESERCVFGFL